MKDEFKVVNGVETLRVKRDFDPVDSEEYEKWLEGLELEGWNLKEIVYINEHLFIKGKKRKIRYCLDENEFTNGDYKKIFEDFGWVLKHKFHRFYLWMIEYEGEKPEAFGEIDDIINKNNKYLKRFKWTVVGLCIVVVYELWFNFTKGGSPIMYSLFVFAALAQWWYLIFRKHKKFLKAFWKNRKLIKEYQATKGL